jgi:hypothetical protein
LGHKLTPERVRARSAHPQTTDIVSRRLDVRFVPSATERSLLGLGYSRFHFTHRPHTNHLRLVYRWAIAKRALPTSRGARATVHHSRSLSLRRQTGVPGTSTEPGFANSMTCRPPFLRRAGSDQRHAGNSSGNGQTIVLSSSGDVFSALAMPPAPRRWHRHCSMPLASHPWPGRVQFRGGARQNRRRDRAAVRAARR